MSSLIDFDVQIKSKPIKFNAPDDKRFMTAIAVEAQKQIRVRTEKDGEDVEGKKFDRYNTTYKEFREKKGRSGKPNLSFTGKMLGSMKAIGKRGMAIVRLSGEQGFKADQNEKRGREFFALSDEQSDGIFKSVSRWVAKNNNLK